MQGPRGKRHHCQPRLPVKYTKYMGPKRRCAIIFTYPLTCPCSICASRITIYNRGMLFVYARSLLTFLVLRRYPIASRHPYRAACCNVENWVSRDVAVMSAPAFISTMAGVVFRSQSMNQRRIKSRTTVYIHPQVNEELCHLCILQERSRSASSLQPHGVQMF